MQYNNSVEDALPGGSTSYLAYAGVDRLVWDNLYVFATSLMDIAERAQSTGRLTRQDLLRMRADTEGVALALDILEKNMPSSAIGLSTSAPQMQPRPVSALAYSSSSFASTRSTIGLGSARASTSSPLMDRRGYLHGIGRPTTMTMMPTTASNQRRNSFCTAYPSRDNTADCSFGATACRTEDGCGCGSSISAAARTPPAACGRPLSLSYPMHSVPKQQHQAGDEERIPRTASDSMIDRLTSGIPPRNSSPPQDEEKAKWETRRASYVGETSMTGKRSGPETVTTKATMTLSRSDDGQISGRESSKRKRPKLEDKPGQVARKERRCQECKTASTSQWRQGPWGKATLCNACGLRKKRTQIGDEFGLPLAAAAATPMPMPPVKQEQLPTRGEKRVKCERQEEEHAAPAADQAGSGSARDEKPKASIAFLLNRC